MNRVSCAAMGNWYQYGNPTMYPAALDNNVIAVGATTDSDLRSYYSQTGNHIDVTAPGGINPYPNNDMHDIWSTWRSNSYQYLAGTSMATPQISGISSLLKGYNSGLYNDDIANIIRLSCALFLWNGPYSGNHIWVSERTSLHSRLSIDQ